MLKTKDFEILKDKKVYTGKIFSVYELEIKTPKGIMKRQIVRHRNAVAMLILKNIDDHVQVLLTREYRTGTNEVRWAIPAGLIEEKDHTIKDAAIREAEEETGVDIDPKHVHFITKTNSSEGFTDEFIYLFKLELTDSDIQNDALIHFDSDEYIEKKWFDFDEVIQLMTENEFYSAPTVIALQNEMILNFKKRG